MQHLINSKTTEIQESKVTPQDLRNLEDRLLERVEAKQVNVSRLISESDIRIEQL